MAKSSVRTQWLILGLLLCGLSNAAWPCNVPAFRYALERWPADLYQVVVYYQAGPPGEEVKLLQKSAAGQGGLANYSLETVDVARPEGKARAEQRRIASYPWVEIYFPLQAEVHGVVWSGPLDSGRARNIIQSRSRSTVAQRLLSGEVAVWVLVRSGHQEKDRRALNSLRTSLERASSTLRIPEIGTDQNGDPIVVTDFRTYPVHFALVELARDDSEEQILISALLKSEPDLKQYDEPMAFPVFGRGRALYALVGDGIQEENILEACGSLINWCSCEIKALNPGTDLLISADWSRPRGGKMVKDPEPPLVGLGGFVPDPAVPNSPEAAAKTDSAKPGPAVCAVAPASVKAAGPASGPAESQDLRRLPGPLSRNLLYLAGGAGLLLLCLTVFVTVRRKK